jgi:hypothetical protein
MRKLIAELLPLVKERLSELKESFGLALPIGSI